MFTVMATIMTYQKALGKTVFAPSTTLFTYKFAQQLVIGDDGCHNTEHNDAKPTQHS